MATADMIACSKWTPLLSCGKIHTAASSAPAGAHCRSVPCKQEHQDATWLHRVWGLFCHCMGSA
jgi:hypothetical protein